VDVQLHDKFRKQTLPATHHLARHQFEDGQIGTPGSTDYVTSLPANVFFLFCKCH